MTMLKTAYRFMMYSKAKTIGAMTGVIVSIFLIGQQAGIFIFLTGLMDALVSNTQAEIWIVGENVNDVNSLSSIDIRKGHEARSIEGVKSVYPLIISGSTMKLRNGKTVPVQIIGSLSPFFIGGPWNIVKGELSELNTHGGIAADQYDLANLDDIDLGDQVSLGGRMVELRAITRGARGFGANYIFTSIPLARELGQFNPFEVSAFLVECEESTSASVTADRINRNITGIKAWTKKSFSLATITTILKDGGIGESIGSLIVFAVIAGGVIIGLTLYSAAIDRINDYATMKAIGTGRRTITELIMLQASIIAVAGFIIGSLLIQAFKLGVKSSGVRFSYAWYMWLALFIITLIISLSGAYFASRSISKVEPSKVF